MASCQGCRVSLAGAAGVPVESASFSGDGHTLAFGDANAAVRLWDVANPAHPRLLGAFLTGSTGVTSVEPVNSVALRGDGHMLALGKGDGTVQIWDLADPT